MPTPEKLETAYAVRDLIYLTKDTQRLMNLIFDTLDAQAVAMSISASSKIQVPVYEYAVNQSGYVEKTIVGYRDMTTDEAAVRHLFDCGFREGLKWLGEEISQLVRWANEEDDRKKQSERDKE